MESWIAIVLTIIGLLVGNGVTIFFALKANNQRQSDKQDGRFKELWEANDKRVDEIKDVRKDFQGAIGRIERDLSATIKEVAETLADHRVEDAQKYATREELMTAVNNFAGEIKGLRQDIRGGKGV